MTRIKAQYGVDSPGTIRKIITIGIILYVFGVLILPRFNAGAWMLYVDAALVYTGIFLIIEGLLMIWYGKYGKLKHRDRILGLFAFSGNERVLDIGAGSGLLAVGVASKLSSGRVTAIDLWQPQDLTDNTKNALLANARLELVENKIEVLKAAVPGSGLPEATYDLILSNRALSRLNTPELRKEACQEINLLLKDNGVAILSDYRYMAHYMLLFHELGCQVEKIGTYLFSTFPALTVIKVSKNGGA